MTLQPNEYRCAMCQGVYTKAIADEEAMAETATYWPGTAQQDCAVLCDDCYQAINPETHPVEYQDSLIEAIEQTYRQARTDPVTGEILPVDVALRKLIEEICSAYAIPPALLGEPLNTNRINGESQMEAYKRMIFGKKRGNR